MIKTIQCPDLSNDKFVSFYTNIRKTLFKITFKWNEYSECCYMSIYDADGNELTTGNALVNKCRIHNDNRVLPNFLFFHKDNLSIEPTLETFSNYGLAYEDTTN